MNMFSNCKFVLSKRFDLIYMQGDIFWEDTLIS